MHLPVLLTQVKIPLLRSKSGQPTNKRRAQLNSHRDQEFILPHLKILLARLSSRVQLAEVAHARTGLDHVHNVKSILDHLMP